MNLAVGCEPVIEQLLNRWSSSLVLAASRKRVLTFGNFTAKLLGFFASIINADFRIAADANA